MAPQTPNPRTGRNVPLPGAGRDQRLLAEARSMEARGDTHRALAIYTGLLRKRPGDIQLRAALGHALTSLGTTTEARKHLTAVLKRHASPMVYRDLARCHELEGNPDEALRMAERGLRAHPDEPTLIAARAGALAARGDYEQAWASLEPHLAPDPHHSLLITLARVAGPAGRAAEGVDALRGLLERPRLTPATRTHATFLLASLLDRLGEHDAAFDAAEQANRLQGSRFDREAFEADVDRMLSAWTPEAAQALLRAPDETRLPVFIVGMPRSGTSLLEQIIASHPEAFGGGECHFVWEIVSELAPLPRPIPMVHRLEDLGAQTVRRHARRLLSSMRRLGRSAARVTDKQPANCFHLGLLSLLAPGATVLHCRRDPMDTCVSCFFQGFGAGVRFAGDFDDLACSHAAVDRVMQHWKRVLDLRIVDVVYERLVQDFDNESRSLIDAVALEWHEACARFHETRRAVATASADQVRTPLFSTSIGRWRRYGERAAPLREALIRRGVEGA